MNNILIQFRKKHSVLKFTGILIAVLIFASCRDYLSIDRYIDEQLKYDSIFANKRYIEAHMWDAASRFPDEGAILGGSDMYTPGPMATDEAFTLLSTGEFLGMAFVTGALDADNLGNLNKWKLYYQIIRQCNTILLRIDEASDWKNTERTRVLAYTRFIRAYAYYNLLVNWGPVVILYDEIPNNNEEMAYYDRPRDLYDECMEYICSEFETAAKDLPEKATSIMDFGRPTKGAAYALVARLRLMHASPLYNGGRAAKLYFGNWTRKVDGQHYIAQNPDPKRWAVAAAAAKRVMDLTIGGAPAYKLHTIEADDDSWTLPEDVVVADPNYRQPFPDGAAGIDPYRSYAEMFDGETVIYTNPEYIWVRTSSSITRYTQRSFPYSGNGQNAMCVTQKIIDAYEMADGRERTNSSVEYPYSETGFTESMKEFSGYRLNAGVHNMYVNREMRFYASIGFSECYWPCISAESSFRGLTVRYYNDDANGKSGATDPTNYPITGYVIKKYINPIDAWVGTTARRLTKAFPIIRYAEILLSYAEALNSLGSESYTIEVDGVSQTFFRDVNEIKKYINQVRYRSGLPGLTDSELTDANLVLSKIKKERMIEFLYENRRYFDIRRWGDYEESEGRTIMGMNTAGSKDSYYQRVIPASTRIANRVVNRKMHFLPIPKTELKRIPSFDQNPGW
jgi:hypothetical protein